MQEKTTKEMRENIKIVDGAQNYVGEDAGHSYIIKNDLNEKICIQFGKLPDEEPYCKIDYDFGKVQKHYMENFPTEYYKQMDTPDIALNIARNIISHDLYDIATSAEYYNGILEKAFIDTFVKVKENDLEKSKKRANVKIVNDTQTIDGHSYEIKNDLDEKVFIEFGKLPDEEFYWSIAYNNKHNHQTKAVTNIKEDVKNLIDTQDIALNTAKDFLLRTHGLFNNHDIIDNLKGAFYKTLRNEYEKGNKISYVDYNKATDGLNIITIDEMWSGKPERGHFYTTETYPRIYVKFETNYSTKPTCEISCWDGKIDKHLEQEISMSELQAMDTYAAVRNIANNILSQNYVQYDWENNSDKIFKDAYDKALKDTGLCIIDEIEDAEKLSNASSLIMDYAKEKLENSENNSTKDKIIETLISLSEEKVNELFESGELFNNVKDLIEKDNNISSDIEK